MAMGFREDFFRTTAARLIEVNLAAGVPDRAEYIQALRLWGNENIDVYPPAPETVGDHPRVEIYGPTPLPTGSSLIIVDGTVIIPPEAERPLRWGSIAVVGGGVLALGYGLWWWKNRRRSQMVMSAFMQVPRRSNRCCPPGAKMLSSGTCQDQGTKRFVKSIPCAQRMAPRRVIKVGMEPVRTWPAPRPIGGWI